MFLQARCRRTLVVSAVFLIIIIIVSTGEMQENAGQSSCDKCRAGMMCDSNTSTPTLACPKGQFCPEGTAVNNSRPCPAVSSTLQGPSFLTVSRAREINCFWGYPVKSTTVDFLALLLPFPNKTSSNVKRERHSLLNCLTRFDSHPTGNVQSKCWGPVSG